MSEEFLNVFYNSKKESPQKVAVNNVDLSLAVMCSIANRDETLSTIEIAEVCGCSQSLISQISRDAIKKLQGKLGEKLRDFQ